MSQEVVKIIDISAWQQDVNYDEIKRAGVKAVILRVSHGHYYGDIAYQLHKREFRKRCILVGGYHYFEPAYDPTWQAQVFCAALGTVQFPPDADLESVKDCENTNVKRMINTFLRMIQVYSRKLPMIYCRAEQFNRYFYDPKYPWSNHLLHVAHYTKASQPYIPKGWDDWDLWQYTNKGRIPGIKGNVDFNRLNPESSLAVKYPQLV